MLPVSKGLSRAVADDRSGMTPAASSPSAAAMSRLLNRPLTPVPASGAYSAVYNCSGQRPATRTASLCWRLPRLGSPRRPDASAGRALLSFLPALALPTVFTVGAGGALRWTDYGARGFARRTIDGEPREDRTTTLSLLLAALSVFVRYAEPRLRDVGRRSARLARRLAADLGGPQRPWLPGQSRRATTRGCG